MDQITRTPKQLGTILRRRRKEVGLSQEALASRIHLRQATISALENSATDTRLDTVFDALAALLFRAYWCHPLPVVSISYGS